MIKLEFKLAKREDEIVRKAVANIQSTDWYKNLWSGPVDTEFGLGALLKKID